MSGTASEALPAPQYDVAIILVAYKAVEIIERCLPTVTAHLNGVCAQIILVDNESGDGTVEYVRGAHPQVQVIEMGCNAGFARANNAALEVAQARHVLLLNTDVIFHDDVLGPLVQHLDANPDVAAVTPAMVDGAGQPLAPGHSLPKWWTPLVGSLREICGGRAHVLRGWANRAARRREQVAGAEGEGAPVETEWIPGACMMLSGEALRRVGKLDPRFFVFFEDVDWCARARRAGMRIQVLPALCVTHLVGGGKSRSLIANKAYIEAEFLYHKLHNPRSLWFVRGTLLSRQMAGLLLSLVMTPFGRTREGEVKVRCGLIRGLLTPGWTPGADTGARPSAGPSATASAD